MQPPAGQEVAAVILSVIAPAATGHNRTHLVDDASHATCEDSTMHHPTDDWNRLIICPGDWGAHGRLAEAEQSGGAAEQWPPQSAAGG